MNSDGIDVVVDNIMSSPDMLDKTVGHISLMSSCYQNKRQINEALDHDDDGANILSLVTPSDDCYAGYQLVQKQDNFIDKNTTKFAEWDCSHGMTGMCYLVI